MYTPTNSLTQALRQAVEADDPEAVRVILGLETTVNGRAWPDKKRDEVHWPPAILTGTREKLNEYLDAYHTTCERYGIDGIPVIIELPE